MIDGPNTQVLVWRYGARKGVSIPAEVDEQLRLGHELREHLVELVHERERAVAAVWAKHAEVAAAHEAAERAQVRLDELLELAAQERERSRRRTISVKLREQIADARQVRREAKTTAREAKDRVYATVAPALHEARAIERQGRKAAYGEFVHRRGLYWATFNNVARKHTLADRRISSQRKQGRRAQLRHHGYDGTGRIAVQLQREQHEPERTAELLCAPESPWWGMLRLPPVAAMSLEEWTGLSRAEQRHRGRAAIEVRIGSEDDRSTRERSRDSRANVDRIESGRSRRRDRAPVLWEIPAQVHRPIPPGAEILSAEVLVTRVAMDRRVSVSLTVRTRAPTPVDGPALAVNIGWRAMPDGSIRVAYWRGSKEPAQQVRVPEHLAGVLRVHASGCEGEVRLPASWRQLDARIAKIRSGRDKDLDRIRATASAHLLSHPHLAEALALAPGDVARWRSPARMVSLGRQLTDIKDASELREQIAAWERQDRHLWRWEANEREQLSLRRRDAYRATAALLTDCWPHAVLESPFVSYVLHRRVGEQRDGHQTEHARANARLAAPAELADAIRKAAMRRGGSVTEIDPQLSTRRHHACDQILNETDTTRSVVVECPHCGAVFDQDQNAVMNMLRERSGTDHASPEPDGSVSSRLESRRANRARPKALVR